MPKPALWSWIQSFILVTQEGGTHQAARHGLSQPTLSRHITALENHLGVELFDRTGRGLMLTPVGEDVFKHAMAAQQHVFALMETANDASSQPVGPVRVSVPDLFAHVILRDWPRDLIRTHPTVRLEWMVKNNFVNLLDRDADVALALHTPTQLDLIARNVGSVQLGMYASAEYVEAHGMPTAENHQSHRWIGWDRDEHFVKNAKMLGLIFELDSFALRTDDEVAQLHAIRAGIGVGVIWECIAAHDPQLVAVLPGVTMPKLPVSIVARREVHSIARIRTTFDALTDSVRQFLADPLSMPIHL